MDGDEIPRRLPERTGRHFCISCLAETPEAEYYRNDHICDACIERDAFPLASTPGAEEPKASAGGE